ncbi:MAG: hydantoinase/oxoprolinase family protein [Proteobacteria bacterium]|nr:hydantoinase/oxoprolinase family protein [Pseudomonadota bacterium]
MSTRKPLVLGIDAGGTMTDTFIVDESGGFVVGKAATTPADESIGLIEAAQDASDYWDVPFDDTFRELEVTLYSGTTMLNTLLQRRGKRLGLITTRGIEDDVLMGRGVQTWAGYSYSDRIHAVTHVHPQPLLQRRMVFGVTERVDAAGETVIPLYEDEVRDAVEVLVGDEAEAIVIHFLFSFLNQENEKRAEQIVLEELERHGLRDSVPVYVGSELRPVIRENSRLNAALIEAYAAGWVRGQLQNIESAIQTRGFRYPLQTVLAYGGLCNIRHPRLHETFISGPVGGVMGARYVSQLTGMKNIIVTDLGGTSFDIASITDGYVPVEPEPTLARFKLNLPTIAMESIGNGCGSLVKVDPVTRKFQIGPESAGSDPGPVCFGRGGEQVTVTDCNLVLGYLNPDYFLGGKVRLDVEGAERAVREQLTDVIGIDLHEGAEAVLRLMEREAQAAIRSLASTRGLDTSDYYLFGYGGAGPMHLAGYSAGMDFSGVITFPFAAAFSAFGCTTADYQHRYARTVALAIPNDASDAAKADVCAAINSSWAEMEIQAKEELLREVEGEVRFTPLAMIRYGGQLSDLEHVSRFSRLEGPRDLEGLIDDWEDLYARINSRVAKYEKAGYQIFELGMLVTVEKVKPRQVPHELGSPEPAADARKSSRRMYYRGEWVDASTWEMDLIQPGNRIPGPAIIEHPATTLIVPPQQSVESDEWGFLWLK